MIIREALKSDADTIAKLHALSWRRTYAGILRAEFLDNEVLQNRLDVWRERFAHPETEQQVCVGERAAGLEPVTLCGFACWIGRKDPRWGTMLDNLHVHPDSKAQGIGTRLIAHAARHASERYPESGFYLWVYERNERARRFYERLGGTLSEAIDAEVAGGGRATECRYTWPDPAELATRAARHADLGPYGG